MSSILILENVTKRFSGLAAVDNFSMTVEEGSIHGLIGPNGAGKTTLFQMISGFEKVTSGKIVFNGRDITNQKPYTLCSLGLARTFQIVKPFRGMTTLDNVMVGGFTHTSSIAEARQHALRSLELTHLDHKADQQARGLNLCEQKRLEVARALATQPKLLLLDEVMAGLTPSEVQEVMDIILDIRQSGITIIIIEHIMQAVMSISDVISVISFGKKITDGTPEEVASNDDVIAAYLGSDFVKEKESV